MTAIASDKTYAAQEETYFNDGREIELLHFVYNHPDLPGIRGSPAAVLRAIDEFGQKRYLMNVGSAKGPIITDLITEHKPKVHVELGSYVGYSTILFADAMRSSGISARLYSLERNPEFAAIASSLIDLAGLRDMVQFEVGPSAESIIRLQRGRAFSHIDLLFLDHYKPSYTYDLKLAEQLNLIGPGSLLVADNVIKPWNPVYLDYVRSSAAQKRERYINPAKKGGVSEEELQLWADNPLAGQQDAAESSEVRGNPRLVYESRLVESYEPTGIPDGIEITKCVREETS